VEWIFEKNGTWLLVLSTDVSAKSNEAGELAKDLLFILRYLWQDIMEYILPSTAKEDEKLPKPKEEWLKLRQWIGTACWTYNQCLIARCQSKQKEFVSMMSQCHKL